MIENLTEIRELLSVWADYIYISLLKYILVISQNIFIVYPLLALFAAIFFALYKYTSFQRISVNSLLLVALLWPVTIFIYGIRFLYVAFERFVYYKIFGIDYFRDVPRRKRDYILEQSLREQILKKQQNRAR